MPSTPSVRGLFVLLVFAAVAALAGTIAFTAASAFVAGWFPTAIVAAIAAAAAILAVRAREPLVPA